MENSTARQRDWISSGLLFLLLQVAAARLVTTDWAPYLYWTETLTGFGTVLGLALGSSRFRRGLVLALAAAYTTTVVPWELTRSVRDEYLLDRLSRVGAILVVSFSQFLHRQPVKDTLFFLLFVCLVFWLIGVTAGYWLARHGRVLTSIALAGAVIVIVQAYGDYQPRGSWWLAFYALIAVLLAGRVNFLEHRKQWAQGRVFVSEESGSNVLAGLFMTAALAILAAWWIPSSSGGVQRAADTWNTYVRPIRERLSNAVMPLGGPYGKPGSNFYGGLLPLGQGAATGDAIVLTVKVLESPGLNMRYYWRGRVYNDYEGGLWSASTTSRLIFHPDQDSLGIPDASDRSTGLFRVTSQFPTQSLIYGPATAVWIDRTVDVAAMRAEPNVYDAFSWEARTLLSAGSTYDVRAELRNPTVRQLRAAGEAYPSWVTEEYLGVPGKSRAELASLAEEITTGTNTAYDKAAAITNYLRLTIEYSSSVPSAPEGRDPVMWVLQNHRKGFCNYYASAQVLLLRSIGIPARLAVGFARGELDSGVYTVTRRDAHAWPEVYFPGIGWVEFEPTANQDPLVRASGALVEDGTSFEFLSRTRPEEEANRIPELVEIAPPAAPLPFPLTPAGRALCTALPFLAAVLAIALAYRLRVFYRLPAFVSRTLEAAGGPAPAWVRSWERWNGLEPVERAFASVTWSLRLLGKAQPINATPAVQAAALSRLLPSAAPQIDVLRGEVETGLFTPRPVDLGRARRASAAVLLQALRARLAKTIAALDGRDVYSERDD
jgi:transglutaminase-like putative cysteine protease